MQAHTIPNMNARGRLAIECMTSRTVALLCARQRAYQIELRAGIDHPADAAKNSIHFSKSSKPIDINGRKTGRLQYQFLVAHAHPRNNFVTLGCLACVRNLTQRNKNHAVASSQIHARGEWSKLNTASGYQSNSGAA